MKKDRIKERDTYAFLTIVFPNLLKQPSKITE